MRLRISICGLALLLLAPGAHATPGDLIADRVLGQKDFSQGEAGFVDSKGLHDPSSVAIDRHSTPNRLYVADYDNSRVLGWADAAAFKKGKPADLVLGQASFQASFCNRGQAAPDAKTLCFPAGVAVGPDDEVYVGDNLNNRVLVFTSPFQSGVTHDQSASKVFGQAGFTTSACAGGASSLCGPAGIAVDDDGDVYVADGFGISALNSRVLEYDDPSAAGGGTPGNPGAAGDRTADRVFGQADFNGSTCNRGAAAAANTLCSPSDVAIDAAGNLLVADTANSRVLVYVNPLSDQTADHVFGQNGSFTTKDGSSGAGGLRFPNGVATDAAGNVWIADTLNARVLEFDTPLSGDKLADTELGGGAFPSRRDLGNPPDVDVDVAGNVYVADGEPPANYDGGYSRVLRFKDPLTTDDKADGVLGQKGYETSAPNSVDSIGLAVPRRIAFDRSVSPPHLYVADRGHNRVLGWSNAASFANGQPADLVLGQTNFKDHYCNQNDTIAAAANTLCEVYDVAVDALGNLWVADFGNHRVLEFDQPFESGFAADQAAARVFGQADFSGKFANRGVNHPAANTFNQPTALTVDGLGNLWVADSANYRVLMFRSPLLPDRDADFVLGQSSFTTATFPANATADAIAFPFEIIVDKQANVFVSDSVYDRVLVFFNPRAPGNGTPGTPGAAGDHTADRVFGHKDFSETGCNNFNGGGRTAQSLCGVNGLALDGSGRLWVADGSNQRMLRFDAPLSGDATADAVIGAPDFTTRDSHCGVPRGTSRFCFPQGAEVDPSGNLWIADASSARLLVFDAVSPAPPPPPTCNGEPATIVGTDTDDRIKGTPGKDVIVAGEGDDVVDGGLGDDVICGGNGDDTLKGGKGADKLFGEGDDDTLNGGKGADQLDGGGGTDACNGGDGANTLQHCE